MLIVIGWIVLVMGACWATVATVGVLVLANMRFAPFAVALIPGAAAAGIWWLVIVNCPFTIALN